MSNKVGKLPEIGSKVIAHDENASYSGIYERPNGWKYGRLRIANNKWIVWSFFVKWEPDNSYD